MEDPALTGTELSTSMDIVLVKDDAAKRGGPGPPPGPTTAIYRPPTASVGSSVFNLANTILGAGMLGLPAAFSACGWAVGSILLFLFALPSAFGLQLLSDCADRVGRPSNLYAVAEAALPRAGLIIDIAISIKCFGVATSYLIVVGDSMPLAMAALGAGGAWGSRQLWSFLAALCVAPLAYLERIDALKVTSLISLLCVLIVSLLIFLFAIQPSPAFDACPGDGGKNATDGVGAARRQLELLEAAIDEQRVGNGGAYFLRRFLSAGGGGGEVHDAPCRGEHVVSAEGVSVLHALPIFVFAYTCHQNAISITNELHRPTKTRIRQVIASSIGLAMLEYIVIAISGYATFGASVDADILATYPAASPLVAVARCAIAIVVTFSYPLQSHPARACVTTLVRSLGDRYGCSEQAAAFAARLNMQPAKALRLTITTIFLILSTILALCLSNLGLIMSIVGATGSTTISYILPGGCYFLLFKREVSIKRSLAGLQCATGLIFVPLMLVLIFAASPERHTYSGAH
jgi:amino acid permease